MPTGAASTHYTARLLAPDLLERGRAQTLQCPVYRDGALVAPTEAGSTVSIYDAAGVAVVDGVAVTVTGSIAEYAYTPAASLDLGEGWRVEWSLIISGDPHLFRNDAALVRAALYPVVADADLFRRCSGLDPAGTSPLHSLTDLQDHRDEAWAEITLRLIAKGNRPNLVMSPSALRPAHLALSLALIFEDFASRLREAYREIAKDYRDQYEAAWRDLAFLYDEDDDGEIDDAHTRRPAQSTVWLSGRA